MVISFRSYLELARLHRPIGIWLLFFPSFWVLCFTVKTVSSFFSLSFIFLLGAIFLRGAGCTYNDMVDRQFDCSVRRTHRRPLAQGALSLKQAFIFFLVQVSLGSLLLFFLPFQTLLWALGAMVLVFIYPWLKRWTYWPQVFLGLTFGWGIFMAWSATGQSFSFTPFCLYGVAIAWIVGFDTIYAYQDIEDDEKLGLKSTAILSRQNPRFFIGVCYGLSFFFLILLGVVFPWKHPFIYCLMLLSVASHFSWQVYQVDPKNPDLCGALFLKNTHVGWILSLGFFLSSFEQGLLITL